MLSTFRLSFGRLSSHNIGHFGHFGHFGNGPGLAVLIELSGLLKLHSQANVTHLQNSFVMVVSIDKELIFSGKPLLPAEI